MSNKKVALRIALIRLIPVVLAIIAVVGVILIAWAVALLTNTLIGWIVAGVIYVAVLFVFNYYIALQEIKK